VKRKASLSVITALPIQMEIFLNHFERILKKDILPLDPVNFEINFNRS